MELKEPLLDLMQKKFIPELTQVDWWILEVGVEVLGPFQRAMVS